MKTDFEKWEFFHFIHIINLYKIYSKRMIEINVDYEPNTYDDFYEFSRFLYDNSSGKINIEEIGVDELDSNIQNIYFNYLEWKN